MFTNLGFSGNGYSDDVNLTAESQSTIIGSMILECCTPDEVQAFVENYAETQAALKEEVLTERTIVKFDKKAKLSRAYKAAIFQIAKEKKDPKFKKLITIWKMERFLENFLEKKYGNEAKRRAKKSIANAKKSNVKVANQAAARLTKSLNKTK